MNGLIMKIVSKDHDVFVWCISYGPKTAVLANSESDIVDFYTSLLISYRENFLKTNFFINKLLCLSTVIIWLAVDAASMWVMTDCSISSLDNTRREVTWKSHEFRGRNTITLLSKYGMTALNALARLSISSRGGILLIKWWR